MQAGTRVIILTDVVSYMMARPVCNHPVPRSGHGQLVPSSPESVIPLRSVRPIKCEILPKQGACFGKTHSTFRILAPRPEQKQSPLQHGSLTKFTVKAPADTWLPG